jgi:hypothetical protein
MDIFRVQVSLIGIEPPIWRGVELSSQTTLKQFHRILQIAMGWTNSHLHEFIVGGQRYGAPDMNYDEPGEVIAEGKVHLSEVLPVPEARILYVYDFGDYWQHSVHLEAILSAQPEIDYPRVWGGARSCPPEDCGGTTGYADLVNILLDPTHEDFQQMREWAGEEFNAEVFRLEKINARLRRNRSLVAKK